MIAMNRERGWTLGLLANFGFVAPERLSESARGARDKNIAIFRSIKRAPLTPAREHVSDEITRLRGARHSIASRPTSNPLSPSQRWPLPRDPGTRRWKSSSFFAQGRRRGLGGLFKKSAAPGTY